MRVERVFTACFVLADGEGSGQSLGNADLRIPFIRWYYLSDFLWFSHFGPRRELKTHAKKNQSDK